MNDNLPPLPPCAPEFKPRWPNDPGGYTADQMQAYARAVLAAAPQPQPVQEPVAWRILDKDPLGCGDDRWVVYTQDDFKPGVCPTDYFNIEPLYTSPQAQPLTVEQIWENDAIMELNADAGLSLTMLEKIVRIVEASHGITEGTT